MSVGNFKRVFSRSVLLAVCAIGSCSSVFIACSSLQDSQTGKLMRAQGSFECKLSSLEKAKVETPAESDVARVRCAQDRWKIEGTEILFTRSLFQMKTCDHMLGQIRFSMPLETSSAPLNSFSVEQPSCELLRTNPSWVGEHAGKCMLVDVVINQPVPLGQHRCIPYVPSFCEGQNRRVSFNAGEDYGAASSRAQDADNSLHVSYSGTEESCKRYGIR